MRPLARPPPMPEPTASDTDLPKTALGRLGELGWQALPAIAGAIGVLGFVALVGGAIEWVRFWSAGLPADQAVRTMPREELVTIGAVSLVAFALGGLLAVLLLYVLDSNGSASIGTLRGLVVLAVLEMLVALCMVDLPLLWTIALGAAFVGIGVVAFNAVANVPDRLRDRDDRKAANAALRSVWEEFRAAQDRFDDARSQLPDGGGSDDPCDAKIPALPPSPEIERALRVSYRQALLGLRKARREWRRAVSDWVSTAPADEAERRKQLAQELSAEEACSPPEREVLDAALESPSRGLRVSTPDVIPAIALGVLAAGAVIGAIFGKEEVRLLVAVLVVVVVLALANFGLARATRRFAWYGAGALLSLILFGATLNIGRTVLDPKVQPLALVRKSDGRAICGVYVTETAKRLYVGRVVDDRDDGEIGADLGSGRMFWVRTDDVDVATIGPLQEIEDAETRARLLTNEVIADRPETAARQPASQAKIDDIGPCATPEITEKRVDDLKPVVRGNRARHSAP